MDVSEGNENELEKVAEWFYWLHTEYEITLFKCGYDDRFSKSFLNKMDEYNFETEMIVQSKKVLTNATKLVERELHSKLIHGLNDVDKWCLGNSAIEVNKYDQCQVVKMDSQPEKKIDGAVTLVMLYEMFRRYKSEFLAQFDVGS